MGRNDETTLASVKQAALQNTRGIWPVRATEAPNPKQTHLTDAEAKNIQTTATSAFPSKTTQLFKQSNKGHLSRTGKIERKLEALQLMRSLNENRAPEDD